MEWEGVNIDSERLAQLSLTFGKQIESEDGIIQEMAGMQFNTASPKQLGEVLFDHLKLDAKAKKTRTGQYATNEETLKKLEGKHPIVEHIFELRELQKLKGTYLDALPDLRLPRSGRVHTSFNQAVAATGRLSSTNPNLQNIPNRTARGRDIRTAFVPRSAEFRLVSADYSQVELRLIAELSGEERMKEAFRLGQDIHSATAARIFGVPLEQVEKSMRNKAKMVNFGIIYGISAFGLSERLNIPRQEAKEIIDNYFKEFGMLRQYMQNNIEFAKQHGFVETLIGRRRYLRDINSANAMTRGFAERNAINAPIQGTAADMIKIAMINIHKRMKEERLDSKMILQVHDELVFDVHPSELEKLKVIVSKEMREALPLKVPVEVEMGTGRNWLEAH
jgi:DNA polymerase-1